MPTIRFVGGHVHNRFCDIDLVPVVSVPYQDRAGKIKHDLYRLAEFMTTGNTTYFQYIHESCVHGQSVEAWTYREKFPRWQISKRELDSRLRRAWFNGYTKGTGRRAG